MKTRIELISEDQKEEVVIKCYQITDEIQSMISFLENEKRIIGYKRGTAYLCLLYTSPSPRDSR